MPQKQTQKVKGCHKCSRSKKKDAGRNTLISLFIRGKISGAEYFKQTNQKVKC